MNNYLYFLLGLGIIFFWYAIRHLEKIAEKRAQEKIQYKLDKLTSNHEKRIHTIEEKIKDKYEEVPVDSKFGPDGIYRMRAKRNRANL
jgi:hypothetical protein